jgi:hypothetical protein
MLLDIALARARRRRRAATIGSPTSNRAPRPPCRASRAGTGSTACRSSSERARLAASPDFARRYPGSDGGIYNRCDRDRRGDRASAGARSTIDSRASFTSSVLLVDTLDIVDHSRLRPRGYRRARASKMFAASRSKAETRDSTFVEHGRIRPMIPSSTTAMSPGCARCAADLAPVEELGALQHAGALHLVYQLIR